MLIIRDWNSLRERNRAYLAGGSGRPHLRNSTYADSRRNKGKGKDSPDGRNRLCKGPEAGRGLSILGTAAPARLK